MNKRKQLKKDVGGLLHTYFLLLTIKYCTSRMQIIIFICSKITAVLVTLLLLDYSNLLIINNNNFQQFDELFPNTI